MPPKKTSYSAVSCPFVVMIPLSLLCRMIVDKCGRRSRAYVPLAPQRSDSFRSTTTMQALRVAFTAPRASASLLRVSVPAISTVLSPFADGLHAATPVPVPLHRALLDPLPGQFLPFSPIVAMAAICHCRARVVSRPG